MFEHVLRSEIVQRASFGAYSARPEAPARIGPTRLQDSPDAAPGPGGTESPKAPDAGDLSGRTVTRPAVGLRISGHDPESWIAAVVFGFAVVGATFLLAGAAEVLTTQQPGARDRLSPMRTDQSGAVLRGALAGVLIIVPLTALRAVVDREMGDFDGSGWLYLFGFGLLLAYVVAGGVAGHRAPGAPLTNGILAGLGVLVLWLPLRVLIWVVRSESQGLFSGADPVFTVGQLFGQVLFASAFGLVGGLIGARMARGSRLADSDGAGTPLPPRG